MVARVIMDAGKGEGVRYQDSDKLNLRRDNLYLVADAKAIRRDRDFIRPKDIIIDRIQGLGLVVREGANA